MMFKFGGDKTRRSECVSYLCAVPKVDKRGVVNGNGDGHSLTQ
jgi:hypothetical protein